MLLEFQRTIPPQSVHDHEHQAVEWRDWDVSWIVILGVSSKERLVGKEAGGEDQNGSWDEQVRSDEQGSSNERAVASSHFPAEEEEEMSAEDYRWGRRG